MARYKDQFDRMMRYHEYFKQMNSGNPRSAKPDEQKDDVYAFFQNCYHLKDWLKNDSEFQKADKVEEYVDKNKCLIICAYICNASKHARLTRTRRNTNEDIEIKNKRTIEAIVSNGGGNKSDSVSIKMEIKYNDEILDAFEVATDAVVAWKSFMNNLQ